MDPLRYDVVVDPSLPEESHAMLARLTGRRRRVLELGCSTGSLTRLLVTWDCQVTAVEIDPVAAERAAPFCDRLIVGDLDRLDLGDELKGERFDVILAGDVLEHLSDPGRVLTQLVELVARGGHLAISVPNVAHGSVRLALLHGEFPRSDTGLLDATHVQFFTRTQLLGLLEQNGWTTVHEDATHLSPRLGEVSFPDDELTRGALPAVEADPLAWVYQFVYLAVPTPHTGEDFDPKVRKLLDRGHELSELRASFGREAKQVELANDRIAELKESLKVTHEEMALRDLAQTDSLIHTARQMDQLHARLAHLDHLRRQAEIETGELVTSYQLLNDEHKELLSRPLPDPVAQTLPPPSEYLMIGVLAKMRAVRRAWRNREASRLGE